MPMKPKILVLGDSISAAYGMSLEQGWVAQLAAHLKERDPESPSSQCQHQWGNDRWGASTSAPAPGSENQPSYRHYRVGRK